MKKKIRYEANPFGNVTLGKRVYLKGIGKLPKPEPKPNIKPSKRPCHC